MTLKRFTIISSIIVGIILVLSVVLSCIKVDRGVKVVPDQFIVYNKTTAGTTYDEELRPTKYNKILNLYKNMTKLSIMDYMFKGRSLDTMAAQDLDNNYGTWREDNKSKGLCLELAKISSIVLPYFDFK